MDHTTASDLSSRSAAHLLLEGGLVVGEPRQKGRIRGGQCLALVGKMMWHEFCQLLPVPKTAVHPCVSLAVSLSSPKLAPRNDKDSALLGIPRALTSSDQGQGSAPPH